MDTINTRIAWLVENNSRTNTKSGFAKTINISQPFMSQICAGTKMPSDRTIADICREYNVREEWLRNGEGPMKLPEPDSDMEIVNRLLSGEDSPGVRFARKFMEGYFELTPDRRAVMDDFLNKLFSEK